MSMQLNSTGRAHAASLISQGAYDATSDWSFTADDGNALLGDAGDDWTNYARWFLGEDTSADSQTKDRYGYPFGKGGKVYRSALTAIRQRAGQQDLQSIYDAAGALIDSIDAKVANKSAGPMKRAYAVFEIKAVSTDPNGDRIFEGIATTPETDRMGDIVVPEGAKFKLPIPLLWQHDSCQPIGWVTDATVTAKGIAVTCKIAAIAAAGQLKDMVDFAWDAISNKLVRGLSIGFNPIESAQIDGTWGYKFNVWEWLELSAVTIPANASSTIQTVKAFDRYHAASGKTNVVVRSTPSPGASGTKTTITPKPPEGSAMNIKDQIKSFEATRQAKAARMVEIMEKASKEGLTLNAEEQVEYDGLEGEVKAIDQHLVRLTNLEKANLTTLQQVPGAEGGSAGAANARTPLAATPAVVRAEVETKDGLALAQVVRFLGLAKGAHYEALQMAIGHAESGKRIDKRVIPVLKAAVAAGNTSNSTWAGALVGEESSVYADFVEFLRPLTILGKFGQGGIPGLRRVPFRVALIGQTSGGAGFWVGEGQSKPLTKFDFNRTTLDPLKVANIAVLTQEVIRDSSPSADVLVRDALLAALQERMDVDFVDPNKTASAGISPASITNGVAPITSSGNTADNVRTDIKRLFQQFIAANNAPTSGVWLMDNVIALALSLMLNPLGQPEFPGITMNGGIFQGLPVITSQYVPTTSAGHIVALINASDIYYGDDGGFDLAMSTEASLQMDGAPTANSTTPTPAQLVSMFQTNSVAFRCERTLNWARRRTSAVALLEGVNWGG
jgi:HK97 family phage prohead protease